MLRCDEAACSNPHEGLSMCLICERNIDVDKKCIRQVMNNFIPEVVGDELECTGFILSEIKTVKRKNK